MSDLGKEKERLEGKTYPGNCQVFYGGYFVTCIGRKLISMELVFQSVASALFSLYAPLRSSSRSLRGLRKERELLISSTVSRMIVEA